MQIPIKPKLRNILHLENQNMDELARKEEIRKAYQKELLAQIEAQKKLKEQERLRKLKEDQEEERRIKEFIGQWEPQSAKNKRADVGPNTSLQQSKLKYKDELDKFAMQQSNHYKSQQNFNANRQDDTLDFRLNNTANTAKSLVRNEISRQYIKNSKGFEIQRPVRESFEEFQHPREFNFRPRPRNEAELYGEQRRIDRVSEVDHHQNLFVRQIDNLKDEIMQIKKMLHGELVEIKQRSNETLQDKQGTLNDLKEMKELLVNLQNQRAKPIEPKPTSFFEESHKNPINTLDAVDRLLMHNHLSNNQPIRNLEPFSQVTRNNVSLQNIPFDRPRVPRQQPYMPDILQHQSAFSNRNGAFIQPMSQKPTFEFDNEHRQSNNHMTPYENKENHQVNYSNWKPNKKFPDIQKEPHHNYPRHDKTREPFGGLEVKSDFVPLNEPIDPPARFNHPVKAKPNLYTESPFDNPSFRKPQDHNRDPDSNGLGAKRAPTIETNDSINMLLEKYENMEIELEPQYQKADHFDFDFLQNLIN